MKAPLLVLAALVGASLAGVTSAATPNDEIPHQVVKYADLDLTRQPDATILYRRIKSAARSVCTVRELPVLEALQQQQHCIGPATARAIAQVNAPLVRQTANDDTSGQEGSQGLAMTHDIHVARGSYDKSAALK